MPLPVNIGNPHEMTILQFAETIRRIIGSSSPIVYKPLPVDDPQTRQPDITLARERLGWEPTVSLEDGIERTVQFFRRAIQPRAAESTPAAH
jgi:nucleoside-diphosphate-sugar epimerase